MTDLGGRLVGVSGVDGDGITGIVLRVVGGDGCRSTLGETGPAISDLVLLQCHLTGGDGEVDDNTIADRQGRAVVEGVVATVLLGIDYRGVDRDGVGLGIGVSGNAALARHAGSTGQIPFWRESIVSAGHAGRQRVVDLAAGKTGGDIFGDRVESFLQPGEVTSRVGLAGGDIDVQIVEESDICICVRIRHFLVSSTKADGVERSPASEDRFSCIRGCLEDLLRTLLAVTSNAGAAKGISRHIVRRLTVGQSNNVLGVNSLNISFCK